MDAPLLRDLPGIGLLTLNGGARYTEYHVAGQDPTSANRVKAAFSASTWKVGLEWQVDDDLKLRATRSRDIRAPTLWDLFQGPVTTTSAFTDYLTGVTGTTTVSSQGNRTLNPEVSRTDTFGLVYKPDWLPDFGLTIDYYQIGLNNVITSVSGGTIPSQQVCIASGGTSPYCALVIRPYPITNTSAANYPTKVLSESLNAGKMTTHGIDAEAEYALDLKKFDLGIDGMLGLRLLAAYQPSLLSVSPVPNAPITNQAGAENSSAYPVAAGRATFTATYSQGPFAISAQERWHSSERPDPNPTLVYADPSVPQIFYTDLTLRYELNLDSGSPYQPRRPILSLTIENLFDRDPDLFISTGRTGAQGYAYPAPFDEDVVGRYFTVSVRFEL